MTLPRTRVIPGWVNTFLRAIRNGYSEKTAANAAGVGTLDIHNRMKKDESFKLKYEDALANQKERPRGGLY